ncbi:hypothetical protein OAC50_00010 [bacterium]|nr:hypothetical protein [bacterium]|tara:strand:+ start:312 stop:467 length:156 start_codon:yes stop_codon:yes gene_type:complete
MEKLTPKTENFIKNSNKPVIRITLEDLVKNTSIASLEQVELIKKNLLKTPK